MKLWNLALSNMKGSRSSIISLFFMIMIASILLNVSLTIAIKMNTFFDNKFEQLQEPNINLLLDRSDEQQVYYDYIKQDPRVAASERETVIWAAGRFSYGENDMSIGIAVQQAEHDRQLSPIKLVEQSSEPEATNGIYVPYDFKLNAGYQLGDPFTLHIDDQSFHYTIAGFFESAMMGMHNTGILKFYLPEEEFIKLEEHTADHGVLYSIKLQDSGQITGFLNDFTGEFPDPPGRSASAPLFTTLDSDIVKSVGSMTINIITMILMAFALVIIAVALIVIQFRVSNHITEGMNNIGVLKALGYTSYQVMLSILLQFVIITLSAGVLGAAISYLVLPVFGSVVTTLSGLLWSKSFLPLINLISIALILLLIVLVVVMSSLRIFRLPPVVALRGGIITHNFKKNRFPLDKVKGPLQLLLACKTTLTNMKQNFMISVIVTAITFASVFSVVLYYNIGKDKTAFIHLVGAETSNVMLQITDAADYEQVLTSLEQMEHMTKVAVLDMTSMKVDGQSFYMNISDDYSKLNNQLVYEGRYPKYDNEIAVSWVVASALNKTIGDMVEVEAGELKSNYLITGLSQSISNLGQMTYITVSGAKQVLPHYEGTLLNLYIEGVDNTSFIQQLKAQFGHDITNIIDVTDTIQSQSKIYTSAVFTVMVTVLVITFLVVVLILYLVIKKMILQRKKELGVLRSLGYTTFQLMSQISLSFLPVVVLSVLLGGGLGAIYTNPLLSVLLSSAGVRNVQFIINIPLILFVCIALILLSYVISFLVSYGIKKITTRRLMIEE